MKYKILEINKEGTEKIIGVSEFFKKMNNKNLNFKFDIPLDKKHHPIKIGKQYKIGYNKSFNKKKTIFTILDINQNEAYIKTNNEEIDIILFEHIIQYKVKKIKKKIKI